MNAACRFSVLREHKPSRCPECNPAGWMGSPDECERCEGTGDIYGRATGPIAICPDCNGTGGRP